MALNLLHFARQLSEITPKCLYFWYVGIYLLNLPFSKKYGFLPITLMRKTHYKTDEYQWKSCAGLLSRSLQQQRSAVTARKGLRWFSRSCTVCQHNAVTSNWGQTVSGHGVQPEEHGIVHGQHGRLGRRAGKMRIHWLQSPILHRNVPQLLVLLRWCLGFLRGPEILIQQHNPVSECCNNRLSGKSGSPRCPPPPGPGRELRNLPSPSPQGREGALSPTNSTRTLPTRASSIRGRAATRHANGRGRGVRLGSVTLEVSSNRWFCVSVQSCLLTRLSSSCNEKNGKRCWDLTEDRHQPTPVLNQTRSLQKSITSRGSRGAARG